MAVEGERVVRRRRVEGGRSLVVKVRFTAAEFEAVAAAAAAEGLTVPSFLAVGALRPAGVAGADAKSALTNLVGVRRILAGVATNLNQLTAKLHGTGQLDPATGAVIEATERIMGRAEAAIVDVAVLAGRRS